MMGSPVPTAVICAAYFVFVLMGPSLMANRPAFNIRTILIVYNFAMVAISGYLFYEVNPADATLLPSPRCLLLSLSLSQFLAAGWLNGYSLGCQPVDYSWSPNAMRVIPRISHLRLFSAIRIDRSRWLACAIYSFCRSSSNCSIRSSSS